MRKIIYILFVFLGFNVVSQTTPEEEFNVNSFESNYQAKIEKAEKISDNPVVIDTIPTDAEIKYDVVARHVDSEYKPKLIPPVKLTLNEPLKKLKKNYTSIGFGANGFPEFKYGYNSGRSRDQAFGITLEHFSAGKTISNYSLENKFMDNDLGLVYKKFGNMISFTSELNYSYDAYNLYGVPDADSLTSFVYNTQKYGLGNIKFSYATGYKDSSTVNHFAGLSYHNLFDARNAMEHRVSINGGLKKYIDKDQFVLLMNADYYNHTMLVDTNYGVVFNLEPTITRTGEKFEVKFGGVLSGSLQSISSKINPALRLKGQYAIVDNLLNIYVDMTGGYRRSSYMSLTNENPFIGSNVALRNSRDIWKTRAGFRGALSKTVTFNTGFSFKEVDNDALFVLDTNQMVQNQFDVIYDKVTYTSLYGELTHEGEKLKNIISAQFNEYSTFTEKAAWNLPKYKLKWSMDYTIQELLEIGVDSYVVGKRSVRDFKSGEMLVGELPSFFDLNLDLTYRYNSNLKAFVKFNNLLNNNYQLWNNYPVHGFNFLMGASYKF